MKSKISPIQKKTHIVTIVPAVLALSGVSAWRFLVMLDAAVLVDPARWFAWLGAMAGFALFWLAILWLVRHINNRISPQGRWTALIGAGLLGLSGWLITTPAGLSRLQLELYAEDVWSPHIFSAVWTGDGLWETPFKLPGHEPVPVTLELTTAGPSPQAQTGEVWLVGATWPDGRSIPFDEFETDGGWQYREIDWGAAQERPTWVLPSGRPGTLRWSGPASGPLTLIFAKHNRAGQVAIHWNGQPEQTLDLFAPNVGLKSLTLPAKQPVVWRADLPSSALTGDVSLSVEPDPLAGFAAVIKKIRRVDVLGQTVEFAGADLAEVLHLEAGQTVPAPGGVQFIPDEPDQPLQIFLMGSLTDGSSWNSLIPWLENGLVVLYLAVIGGVVFGSMAIFLSAPILERLNVAVLSLVAALIIGDLGLRFYLPPADRYFVWRPGLHRVFKPSPEIMPGIDGEAHFIINTEGIRGDEFSPDDDYRILAIGGSTTESLFLDQTEAWPQLVQDKLNRSSHDAKIWVGNVGKAGRTTREHVLQMRYLLSQYPNLDAVILLIGINDFVLRLELGDDYNPNYLTRPGMRQALLERAFDVFPHQNPDLQPYYQQTAAVRLLGRIRQAWEPVEAEEIEIQNENGSNIIKRRLERQNAAVIQTNVGDLSAGLTEYSRNVNTIIDLAEAHQVRLILMTQPTLWRTDLTDAERALLWLGWGPERETFYSLEALSEGMAAYNQRLLEICEQRHVECLDLAQALPKDITVFYDDVHFNESGSEQVAEIVAAYLLKDERLVFGANR